MTAHNQQIMASTFNQYSTSSKSKLHSHLRVWGFYFISLAIHTFLKLFSHPWFKRRQLTWELYKNIKRIASAVCHIYNRKVFYRNTNHHIKEKNLFTESIFTPNKSLRVKNKPLFSSIWIMLHGFQDISSIHNLSFALNPQVIHLNTGSLSNVWSFF